MIRVLNNSYCALHDVRFCACTILVLSIAFQGCGGENTSPTPQTQRVFAAANSRRPEKVGVESQIRSRIRMNHDFGLLRPGEKVQHEFKLHNQTQHVWTVDHVERRCHCTITSVSPNSIGPSQTAVVTVTYRAPSKEQNDQTYVRLHFREYEVWPAIFYIKATIRNEVSLAPKALGPFTVNQDSKYEASFEILNFGKKDWDKVVVRSMQEWLSFRVTEIPVSSVSDGRIRPRQRWRAVVLVDVAELHFGQHKGRVDVVCLAHNERFTNSIPIHIDVEAPVTVIPSHLFFGEVNKGQAASRKFILKLSEVFLQAEVEDVVFRHDLENILAVRWLNSQGAYWQLEATLKPKA